MSRVVSTAGLVWLCVGGCSFDDSKLDATGEARSFEELCALPGVIFCEDFEEGIDPAWIPDGGEARLEPGAAAPGEGAQVVALASDETQSHSTLLYTFGRLLERAWVRFDVLYPEDFVDPEGAIGPGLGGSSDPPYGMLGRSGVRPAGDDFFVIRLLPRPIGGDPAFHLEAYFVNMEPTAGGQFYGNVLAPPEAVLPRVDLGQWQCVEVGLVMNAPGRQDGSAEYRVDGGAIGPVGDLEWRSVDSLGVDTFSLDSYNSFGDGAPPASRPNVVRYDNVVVSREPVGCLR